MASVNAGPTEAQAEAGAMAALGRNWWLLLFFGVISIIAIVLALAQPGRVSDCASIDASINTTIDAAIVPPARACLGTTGQQQANAKGTDKRRASARLCGR